MTLPKTGKPTAKEVADWAINLIGSGVDVDGYYGRQCWDLPNYIFNRFWGFKTPGNARDMAWYRYPAGFKVFRNTSNFVPKSGDIAVWTGGNYNWNTWGHTAIVVGPSTKDYFYSVDQNWNNSNAYYGSPAAKVKHSYFGVTHFVRPAYKAEPKPSPTLPQSKPVPEDPEPSKKPESNKFIYKVVTKILFTTARIELVKANHFVHYITKSENYNNKPNKIVIKNANTALSTNDIYKYRHDLKEKDIPHFYVDRLNVWACRPIEQNVEGHNNAVVLSIAETRNALSDNFKMNEIECLSVAKSILSANNKKMDSKTISIDDNEAWRTFKLHTGKDSLKSGSFTSKDYQKAVSNLIKLFKDKDKLLNNKPKDIVEKIKIRTVVKENTKFVPSELKPSNNIKYKQDSKIDRIVSNYSLKQALNIQFSLNPKPQTSNGVTWYTASLNQTRAAMNTNQIFNDNVQVYQFLKLNQYQGISVDKLNKLLVGKGTLSSQGQAFSDGCKKYGVNEIYLIAHAFLESGNGTSFFASGRTGVYNYFGIGAFDNNPNNAIEFARSRGWTSPAKAIIGGAEFVGKGYFDVGQNTLYRMRWNPKKPGTHQYATDISWAKVQAKIISAMYKAIGLKGEYFIYDQYKK
ncbi:glucosaminidase domain-containing protein [Staphylococcus sp. SQ8-PEA]|uniref:Glucosaminidase domain-containing protein n=1 Tax=Staphylococcus marylandisciuri TaxID=2981529 RepID=A0ABT2QPL4_9STAP|nr:glucosaminidase domain-containing protein [Staphylococcus marylandisciuri]MCU5745914.1 glucosaminidase domain-containing protein [Staphylococcus marylandisciuri]